MPEEAEQRREGNGKEMPDAQREGDADIGRKGWGGEVGHHVNIAVSDGAQIGDPGREFRAAPRLRGRRPPKGWAVCAGVAGGNDQAQPGNLNVQVTAEVGNTVLTRDRIMRMVSSNGALG